MNIQQKIDSRTEKLQAILAGANARVTAKNGTAASNLNGLPDAIDSIPEGGGGGGVGMPEEYQALFPTAETLCNNEYVNAMIAENDKYITFAFLTDAYAITAYNVATTEITAYGWYSCNYTKADGMWEFFNYSSVESPGGNFAKNIRWADCYIEYNGMTLFPVGMNCYPDTVAIDYSAWDSGSFTETIETGDTLTYSVEFNADGQPNKITAPDGTVTWIEWGES